MTKFENLRNSVAAEIEQRLQERINKVESATSKNELSRSETTNTVKQKWDDLSLEKIKENIIKRYKRQAQKSINEKLQKIEIIENAPELKDCTLTVEWKKSATWGSNPQCSLKCNTSKNYEYYESSRVGGCGYDKESAATSQALNQFPVILKLMYALKNDNIDKSNHELLGYGSGYGILPAFEGGVGISTMNQICESIGCEFKHISSGKMFDVYTITKK